MNIIFIIITFLIIIALFIFIKKKKSTKELIYVQRGPLFTKAERSFYGVLKQIVGTEFEVFGKVRVADILTPEKTTNKSIWYKAFNGISAKHFDFVICNPGDLSVLCVVELDDSSHNKKDRIKRDDFIDRACKSAGITIVRFAAARSYSLKDVSEVLANNVEKI